jgi:hypothetical protein
LFEKIVVGSMDEYQALMQGRMGDNE